MTLSAEKTLLFGMFNLAQTFVEALNDEL